MINDIIIWNLFQKLSSLMKIFLKISPNQPQLNPQVMQLKHEENCNELFTSFNGFRSSDLAATSTFHSELHL